MFNKTSSALIVLLALVVFKSAGQSADPMIIGDSTNGFRGEIQLVSEKNHLRQIIVWANHISDTNVIRSASAFTNLVTAAYENWIYYMPTNLFCGPIEIRD